MRRIVRSVDPTPPAYSNVPLPMSITEPAPAAEATPASAMDVTVILPVLSLSGWVNVFAPESRTVPDFAGHSAWLNAIGPPESVPARLSVAPEATSTVAARATVIGMASVFSPAVAETATSSPPLSSVRVEPESEYPGAAENVIPPTVAGVSSVTDAPCAEAAAANATRVSGDDAGAVFQFAAVPHAPPSEFCQDAVTAVRAASVTDTILRPPSSRTANVARCAADAPASTKRPTSTSDDAGRDTMSYVPLAGAAENVTFVMPGTSMPPTVSSGTVEPETAYSRLASLSSAERNASVRSPVRRSDTPEPSAVGPV